MSKKRGKSAVGSASGSKWESAIVSAPLNEEAWWMSISMIVGNKIEDNDIIDFLANGVLTGQRKLFNVVSRSELIKLVNELGNPKVKKGKEVPANFEVCEAAKPYLDANEDIPLSLMAKLIKFKLLDMKTIDQKRRDGEKKGGADKGKKKEKSAGKERGKSAKGKGGKKTPEPPSVKNDSKLRKRGEEDPDAKFIDDEPDDGAKRYVILTGFDHPQLLAFLADVGVQVDSVIKLRAQDYDIWKEKMNSLPESNTTGAAAVNEDEKKLQECKARIQLIKFWRDVTMILRQHSNLKDITLMEYEVKQLLYPMDMEDNEKKLEFSMHLFEDIACLMYDLLDARRQWRNYLGQTRLLAVPDEGLPGSPKSEADASATGSEEGVAVDMRYYHDVLAGLPAEVVGVDAVVHAMLEQVEATEQDKTPPSERQPPQRADHVDPALAEHLARLALRLPLSPAEAKKLETEMLPKMPEMSHQRMTLLLHPSDDIGMRSINIRENGEIDLKKAELDLLFKMEPYSNLLRFPPLSQEMARRRAARLQEMINFCCTEEMTREEVDRALKQFVFENLQLTCTDPTGYVMQPQYEDSQKVNHLWDDPYPCFKTMMNLVEEEEGSRKINSRGSDGAQLRPRSRTPEPPASSDGSRPASGILKRSASSSPSRSRKSSVHFEPEAVLKSLRDCPPKSGPPAKDNEEVMREAVVRQQRQLDEWCFAEHLMPHVFLQILKSATHLLPYIDTYYHKRDHTLLVVLHNPFHPEMLSNHVEWQHWLHADIGFRNYLDHVSESIRDWTTEQEAMYEAEQLRKEVETNIKEDEEAKKKEAAGKKRERSKSPKKGKGARSRSGSRPSSADASDAENFLIRDNSLKAQKQEMDRLLREKEEEERKKQEKRARSAQKRAEKEASEKAAKEKRPNSKASAKSRKSRSPSADAPKEAPEEEARTPEPFWPFVGYGLGDDMVHASGVITTLFPTDGGTIRAERTDFVQGSTHVRTCVLKDGHVFAVHVHDPSREVTAHVDLHNAELAEVQRRQRALEDALRAPEPGAEPGEPAEAAEGPGEAVTAPSEAARPVSFFGSFTARFCDGLGLALSTFGDHGRPTGLVRPAPEPYAAPAPRPASSDPPAGKGKPRGKDKSPTPAPAESAREDEEGAASGDADAGTAGAAADGDAEAETDARFQKLFVSSPDGAQLQVLLETQAGAVSRGEEVPQRRLLLRMRRAGDSDELSRLVTCDGAVLRVLAGGRSQVLFPDGTVADSSGETAPIDAPPADASPRQQRTGTGRSQRGSGDESPSRKIEKTISWNHGQKSQRSGQTDGANAEGSGEASEALAPVWVVTSPSGLRTSTAGARLPPLMVTHALDPSTGQEVFTRADRTSMVNWAEADSCVVEHADGTRITQFGLWHPVAPSVDVETGEETGPAQMDVQRFIRVECPGHASVLINAATGEVETRFGRNGASMLIASPLGAYHLRHREGGQLTIHEDGTCLYTGCPSGAETAFLQVDGLPTYVMRHNADVVCELVDPEGNLFSVDTGGGCQVMLSRGEGEEETGGSKTMATEGVRRYQQHAPRFFIIHPDSSATELLRYQDVAGYISNAERDPEVALIREDLHDCPHMTGISIIRPIKADVTHRWQTTYAKESIYPPGLTSRDLKTLPPTEFKKPGPHFGSNVGKGLAIGSVQHSQTAPSPIKCPRELEFRQFVQCNPIKDDTRDMLRDRILKFAEFVQARDNKMDAAAVADPRSEEERFTAGQLLAKAATIRSNMQLDDVESAFEKATAPPPPPAPPTPQPKRTAADWERDRLALLEEKENRDALRKKFVPNFFRSEFSKDFVLSQATSVKSLSKQLNVFPDSVQTSANESPPMAVDDANKTRPVNPTPGQALVGTLAKSTRPMNPTPGHGVMPVPRPDGPTPKHAVHEFAYFDTNHSVDPSPVADMPPPLSVSHDVTGQARQEEIKVPSYLTAGRPGRRGPNVRQAAVEDPVRRRILTSSVVGGSLASQLGVRRMRGLDILPTRIDFGLLREGYTYRHKVLLKNTGVETCRFKLRQPPPATGIRLFFKPGPIPAGLSTQLVIEVYAIAAGVESGQSGVGLVEHQLQIITDTDVLHLPISLRVMTAHEYDQQSDVSIAPYVELVAQGSMARDGIIRPRRSVNGVISA